MCATFLALKITLKQSQKSGLFLVVDFMNCFAPNAYLLRFAPNFRASKKLLKNWAWSANSWGQGINQFMKSTPGG